jgi:hypothetical protein
MSKIDKAQEMKNKNDTELHEYTSKYPSAELYYNLLLDEYKFEMIELEH